MLRVPAHVLSPWAHCFCPKQSRRTPANVIWLWVRPPPRPAESDVLSGDKCKCSGKVGWVYTQSDVHLYSTEFKDSSLQACEVPQYHWHPLEQDPYVLGELYLFQISFRRYPAYWLKPAIWRRKTNISVLLSPFPEQLSCGLQKGFAVFQRTIYHFASPQGSVNQCR